MATSNDFKTGMTIEIDGNVWQVIEFLHVKPGKGAAFVRSKLRNLQTGNTVEKTFRAGEKVEQAMVERKEMQYLYGDGNEYTVMDMSSFEQSILTKAQIGDGVKYLKEQMIVQTLEFNGKVIGVDIPNHVELEVVDTPPSEKGNTASGGTKTAKLETGAEVQVPFFISNGDKIRVDTRNNQYLDRA